MFRHGIGTASAVALLASPGATQVAPGEPVPAEGRASAGDRVLRSFSRCRSVAPEEQRLACFDDALAKLEAAVRTREITVVDRQDVRRTRRSLFGFNLPRIPLLADGADDAAPAAELNTTVAAVRSLANSRAEVRVAEGDAIWVTTDPLPFPPAVGTKVRIRRGALGNYFLNFGDRGVRGTRVR